jgi:DNA-binding SARP family transcriptional activator
MPSNGVGMVTAPARMIGPATKDGYRVVLLDQFDVLHHDRSVLLTIAGQRLVAFLALDPRRRPRERIAVTLWPRLDRAQAGANLRRTLFTVQRTLPNLVEVAGHVLSLAAHVLVDVRELGLVDAGRLRRVPAPDDVEQLQPELLADWPDAWLADVRETVHVLRLRRLEELAQQLLAEARHYDALDAARVAVRIDPLRESAQRLAVRAHLAAGNRADAVRQFQSYETVLWQEMRLRPGSEIKALLSSDDAMRVPAQALQRA